MLTVQQILNDREHTINRLAIKKFDASLYIDHLEYLEKWRKEAQTVLDELRHTRTIISDEIGEKKGKDCDNLKTSVKELKWWIDLYETDVEWFTKQRDKLIIKFPNIPHELVEY